MTSVVLLGSRPLSCRVLQRLHEDPDIDVRGVVTCDSDHNGWWKGSLRSLANDLNYEIMPEQAITGLDLDYIISILYFNILNKKLLDLPKHGAINLHLAELPRYRGSNVFAHAIMNCRNDDYWRYGVTLHLMSESVDAGDIIDRRFTKISEKDTARSLYEKAEVIGYKLFEENLPAISSKRIEHQCTPQSDITGPRYFYHSDSLQRFQYIPVEKIRNKSNDLFVYDTVRALDFPPFEPAYTILNDQKVYLSMTNYSDHTGH